MKKINFNIINNIPIQSLELIKEEFKHQNDTNYKKKRKLDNIDWDYSNKEGDIKCKIDHENKKNVLYQSSFNGIYDYKDIMEKCVEEFYSNEYEIIVIYSQNTGGFANLCIPLTQYFRPKISDSIPFSQKDTDLNFEYLEMASLMHETCLPFDREKLYRGKVDDYGNGVIHNRTAKFNMYNIIERKYYEKKINKILETGKIKKPTEIIIFTDGFSFSCGSMFIKGLQVYGSTIVVGYNTKPGIISPKDFDSSQSNSGVKQFSISDYADNLRDLGFAIPSITNAEQFDPNDFEEDDIKIPMEFKRYPVDELSDIHTKYKDEYYDRFIKTAEKIFKKYNEDNECNPDNNYLYLEAEECDSKLNIPHGHGGYICNKEGKWDKNNCKLKFCDTGYILNLKNNT